MIRTRNKIEKLDKFERVIKFTTTLLILIILIGISALVTYGQPTSGAKYEVVESYTFLYGNESPAYVPGFLIEFQGDKIISSTKDQTKNLYMRYEWEDVTLKVGNKFVEGKVVEAYDNGGFKCLINYMYDKDVDLYVITILYNNLTHIHFMKPTDQEARPEVITVMAPGDQMTRDYTQEELDWFWANFKFLMLDFTSLSWLD